jgi:hypothetical protein
MLWTWSFIGGLVGTIFMDVTAGWLSRFEISSGLEGLLGRWVLGFGQGQFVIDGHAERLIPSTELENRVAKSFHFIIGGGGVALGYPLWITLTGTSVSGIPLVEGILYGAATLAIAWFVQYPPFGFGAFGRKAPEGSQPLMATIPMHLAYGLGLGLVLQVLSN